MQVGAPFWSGGDWQELVLYRSRIIRAIGSCTSFPMEVSAMYDMGSVPACILTAGPVFERVKAGLMASLRTAFEWCGGENAGR
jgi:hypothetical protein